MSRDESLSGQPPTGVDAFARRVRIVVLAGVLLLFALLGALIGIPWLIGEPLPVIRPDSGAQMPAEIGEDTRMVARVQLQPGGQAVLVLRDLQPPPGSPPRRVSFSSLEGGSLRVEVPIERIDLQLYRGRAVLELPGRWELAVEHASGVEYFRFVLAEF
jgi:hypothetical protein